MPPMELPEALRILASEDISVQRMTLIFYAQLSDSLAGEPSIEYEKAFIKSLEKSQDHWRGNQK